MSAVNFFVSYFLNVIFMSLLMVEVEKSRPFRIEEHRGIVTIFVFIFPLFVELFSWIYNGDAFFYSLIHASIFTL